MKSEIEKTVSEYSVVVHPSAELWASFLHKLPEGSFEQCFEYGEACRNSLPKTRVVRLALVQDGEPAAVVQGTYTSFLGFGLTLKVKHGPLVSTKNVEEAKPLVKHSLKALEDYCKGERIVEAEIWVPESWRQKEAYDSEQYSLVRTLNEYVVDLGRGTDGLWKSFSHNKRRNVKKATESGVEVVSSSRHEDLLTFYSMLEAAEERGGFSTYALPWFEAIAKTFSSDLAKVFMARCKGKELSAVFTVAHGKTLYALAAGSLKEGREVRPNDMMHWEVMKWASGHGLRRYHMGFVSDPPPTEGSDTWGIWRWKREWNGNLERILIFGKLLSPRYRLILKARNLISRHAK